MPPRSGAKPTPAPHPPPRQRRRTPPPGGSRVEKTAVAWPETRRSVRLSLSGASGRRATYTRPRRPRRQSENVTPVERAEQQGTLPPWAPTRPARQPSTRGGGASTSRRRQWRAGRRCSGRWGVPLAVAGQAAAQGARPLPPPAAPSARSPNSPSRTRCAAAVRWVEGRQAAAAGAWGMAATAGLAAAGRRRGPQRQSPPVSRR